MSSDHLQSDGLQVDQREKVDRLADRFPVPARDSDDAECQLSSFLRSHPMLALETPWSACARHAQADDHGQGGSEEAAP